MVEAGDASFYGVVGAALGALISAIVHRLVRHASNPCALHCLYKGEKRLVESKLSDLDKKVDHDRRNQRVINDALNDKVNELDRIVSAIQGRGRRHE